MTCNARWLSRSQVKFLRGHCTAVVNLKCLKMSNILPFQRASCVYTFMLLKSSLVDRRAVEQDRQKQIGPGAERHLGKHLQLFSDAGNYVQVMCLEVASSFQTFGKCDDTTVSS